MVIVKSVHFSTFNKITNNKTDSRLMCSTVCISKNQWCIIIFNKISYEIMLKVIKQFFVQTHQIKLPNVTPALLTRAFFFIVCLFFFYVFRFTGILHTFRMKFTTKEIVSVCRARFDFFSHHFSVWLRYFWWIPQFQRSTY